MSNLITFGGTTKATEIGNYQCTMSLTDKENYEWEDGTTDDIVHEWGIRESNGVFAFTGETLVNNIVSSHIAHSVDAETNIVELGEATGTSAGYSTVYLLIKSEVDGGDLYFQGEPLTQYNLVVNCTYGSDELYKVAAGFEYWDGKYRWGNFQHDRKGQFSIKNGDNYITSKNIVYWCYGGVSMITPAPINVLYFSYQNGWGNGVVQDKVVFQIKLIERT